MRPRAEDLLLLRCPERHGGVRCGASLTDEGDALRCLKCSARWPVRDGVARLYREALVRGNDRLLRFIYDRFAALHDPAMRWVIPLVQTEGSEDALREFYLRRLDLGSLRPHADGSPVRILEVGAGTGANLPLIRDRLPRGLDVEYWALDLSEGMSSVMRDRLARDPKYAPGDGRVRFVMADAHSLPYADGIFDRVFDAGGVGGYRDPATALAEMARVAAPGALVVVIDEQLDRERSHSLYHRAAFRAVTFYEPNPHCPTEHVPASAVDVKAEQATRFFYCLSFRVPG